MFILLSGMADAIEHDTEIEDRVARMMRTSGMGITITSLTDLLGFLIGSLSIFPAIRYFCIYTGQCCAVFHNINQYICSSITHACTLRNNHLCRNIFYHTDMCIHTQKSHLAPYSCHISVCFWHRCVPLFELPRH